MLQGRADKRERCSWNRDSIAAYGALAPVTASRAGALTAAATVVTGGCGAGESGAWPYHLAGNGALQMARAVSQIRTFAQKEDLRLGHHAEHEWHATRELYR